MMAYPAPRVNRHPVADPVMRKLVCDDVRQVSSVAGVGQRFGQRNVSPVLHAPVIRRHKKDVHLVDGGHDYVKWGVNSGVNKRHSWSMSQPTVRAPSPGSSLLGGGAGVSGDPGRDDLLLLAIHERLQQQLRTPASAAAVMPPQPQQVSPVQDARLWQSMLLGLGQSLPGLPNPLELACLPGTSAATPHPLWQHNLCAWPGCDQPAENLVAFLQHLSQAHSLNEMSAGQLRSQVELVDTLEHRLGKERARLQAMMQHLHMKHSPDTTTPSLGSLTFPKAEPIEEVQPQQLTPVPGTTDFAQPSVSTSSLIPTLPLPAVSTDMVDVKPEKPFTPRRRERISDKSILPISTDIARNREFYRTNDVRPPYTYASLIRQAIMESPECQLTLNEIYQWFTETFAYFRRNAATWKNAVRHNLSLHKCFARVEQNVKGAVWTVDDSEFYRRRPQRAAGGGTGAAGSRSQPNTPMPEQLQIHQRLLEDQGQLDLSQVLAARLLDLNHSGDGASLVPEGAALEGLQGVLSFLNGQAAAAGAEAAAGNPLSLLSAAAAAAENESSVTGGVIPSSLFVKQEMDLGTQQQQAVGSDERGGGAAGEEESGVVDVEGGSAPPETSHGHMAPHEALAAQALSEQLAALVAQGVPSHTHADGMTEEQMLEQQRRLEQQQRALDAVIATSMASVAAMAGAESTN